MKTSNYLWAVLMMASLSLSACSSDENEEPQLKGQAKLELTLKGTAMTRATGTLPTTTGEDNINRITVAIFNGDADKTVNVIQEFEAKNIKTDGVNKVVTVNCTQGENCTGIVVANAPAKTFAGVMKKADFIKKNVKLSQTKSGEAGDAPQDADNLPMSGDIQIPDPENTSKKLSTFTLTAKELKATTELSRLVARIAITSVKTEFDAAGQYKDATFKIKKIFLHNAASTSTVGIEVPTTTVPITGDNDEENKYLQNVLSDVDITTAAHTNSYWFYTFANPKEGISKEGETDKRHTKLVIYGEFDADGKGTVKEKLYYPVVVNKLQTGTTIKDEATSITTAVAGKGDMTIARNTRYNITATIKGKGVDSLDKDINPATISLTVSVAEWALEISQDVTFN
ncbi:MAG: fimbrial protein [Bacteroides sp.]|nr:fimbrial protein [Bacteroides sp.]